MARRTSVPSTRGGSASGASARTGYSVGSVVTTRSKLQRAGPGLAPGSCPSTSSTLLPALSGDTENPDDLRHGRVHHVGDLLLGPAGDRVRHRHVLEFREAHDFRH